MFSSSATDPGVRLDGSPKPNGNAVQARLPRPGYWRYALLPITRADEDELNHFARTLLGDPKLHKDDGLYDFSGCARFVIPMIRQHPRRWVCSECVVK